MFEIVFFSAIFSTKIFLCVFLCQVVFEGIRGNGFEGDIAIDDVSVTKGKCKQKDSVDKTGLYHQ